jgi:excinuclease ABC subunit C
VLEAFIEQHYAVQPIPGRIVADQLDTPPEMEGILGALAARPVKIVSRPVGESRTWLEMARKNASLAIGQRLSAQATQEVRVAALQEFLGVENPIARIECFDISHTMGEAPIASCVVYDKGAMQNSEYRRYNVVGVEPGDDYGAMRFALEKRYRKLADAGEGRTPDLILIDGGVGQLNAARAVMADLGLHQIRMIGVAKGVERKPGMGAAGLPGRRRAAAPSAGPSGAAPDPAGARRGAPLRHHRPPRASRQGAHRLAPGGDLGRGPAPAPGTARALRRAAGRDRRQRRRPRPRRGDQP